MPTTKVEAIIFQFKEELAHRPLASLRGLRDLIGITKFNQLVTWLLTKYDSQVDKIISEVPAKSPSLPDGAWEDPID